MSKILLILEVSRKQDYIFSSIHLRDNAARSDIIRYVTSEEFFKQAAPEYYNSRENFVYAGGGHTILQFGDRATATRFAEQVTQKAMREYDGLELFAKQMEYRATDENGKPATPGQNLVWLSEALEQKKSLRKASFRLTSLGIEQKAEAASLTAPNAIDPPEGWAFAKDFVDLQGRTDENFIAVVHIDGNSMGKRVKICMIQKPKAGTLAATSCAASAKAFSTILKPPFGKWRQRWPITRPPIPQAAPESFRYVRSFLPVMMCALSRAAVWVWNVPNGL